MKTLLSALLALATIGMAPAKDGLFELVFEEPPKATPGKDEIVVRMPIKDRPGVKIGEAAVLADQDEDACEIWVDVDEFPGQEFTPVLINGDRALVGSFKLGGAAAMNFIFKCKTLEDAKLWLKFIQKHFKLDDSRVKVKIYPKPKTEQGVPPNGP